ncbi:MAG: Ig-like domain-containing protein [Nanoarchaeota archaeon]
MKNTIKNGMIVLYTIVMMVVMSMSAFATNEIAVCENPYAIVEGATLIVGQGDGEYAVKADYINQDVARFVVNGETTNALAQYERYTLTDGASILVVEINALNSNESQDEVEFCFDQGQDLPEGTFVEKDDSFVIGLDLCRRTMKFTGANHAENYIKLKDLATYETHEVVYDESQDNYGYHPATLALGGVDYRFAYSQETQLLWLVDIFPGCPIDDTQIDSLREYFGLNYDMDLYIYRPPQWGGFNIMWDDETYAKTVEEGAGLDIHFLKENNLDAIVFDVEADNNEIRVKRQYRNTASPERTHLVLEFDTPKTVKVQTIGGAQPHGYEVITGKKVDILLWSHVTLDEWTEKVITVQEPVYDVLVYNEMSNAPPQVTLDITPSPAKIDNKVTAKARVTQNGNPVPGLIVYFRNNGHDGVFNTYPSIGRTDAQGYATITFTPQTTGQIAIGAAATINKQHGGLSKYFTVGPSTTGAVTLTPRKSSFQTGETVNIDLKNGLNTPISFDWSCGERPFEVIYSGVSLNLRDPCMEGCMPELLTTLQPGQTKTFVWNQWYYHFACEEPIDWHGTASPGKYIARVNYLVNGEEKQIESAFNIEEHSTTTKYVRLNQDFWLNEDQTAVITDYKNMKIELVETYDNKVQLLVTHKYYPIKVEPVKIVPASAAPKKMGNVQESGSGDSGGGGSASVTFVPQTDQQSVTLEQGESKTLFGAKISLLEVDGNSAQLRVSNIVEPEPVPIDVVDIGINPRVQNVKAGDSANYRITIKDNHNCESNVCPSYTYKLEAIGLPFSHTLPNTVTIPAGGKNIIDLDIYTGKALLKTQSGTLIAVSPTVDVNQVTRYCAEESGEYEDCVKELTVVGETQNSGLKRYYNSYRFGVQVSTQNGYTKLLDTAFATLHVKQKDDPSVEGKIAFDVIKERQGEIANIGTYKLNTGDTAYVCESQSGCDSGESLFKISLLNLDRGNNQAAFAYSIVRGGYGNFWLKEGDFYTMPMEASTVDSYTYRIVLKSISFEEETEEEDDVITPPPFPSETTAINLERGWNLVSLPNKLVQFLPSSCTKDRKLLGFVYLDDEKRYVTINKAKDILGIEFNEYLATHAFWIYSFQGCTLDVETERSISFTELSLSEGWNLVPITQDLIGKSLAEIATTCDFQKVFTWNAEDQNWVGIDENHVFAGSDLLNGFIARSGNYCEFGGEITIEAIV